MERLRVYWRRRRYERLEGSSRSRKKDRDRVQLGEKGRKRFGRIKIKPRFRWLRLVSPKKLLVKLRDGYVKMMLSFANSAALSGGYGYGSGFGMGEGVGAMGLGRPPLKEYDEKFFVEIYKSLVAQQQLMAAKDGGVGTQINLRR